MFHGFEWSYENLQHVAAFPQQIVELKIVRALCYVKNRPVQHHLNARKGTFSFKHTLYAELEESMCVDFQNEPLRKETAKSFYTK